MNFWRRDPVSATSATLEYIVQIDVLASWNIRPDIVVCNSPGEAAAAYSTGALSAEEALAVSYHRGGVFGHPGQCNYAGSSSFLDAFARSLEPWPSCFHD